jgi:hypothetical protein
MNGRRRWGGLRGSLGGSCKLDIRAFRALTDQALQAVGLEQIRLPRPPRPIPAWKIPSSGEVVRFFSPGAYRRPWGFVYSGFIGIEIPELRDWLRANKTGEDVGVFHTCFVGYLIANEDGLRDFMVEHGEPVPADIWAQKIKDRLDRIPTTIDELARIYRSNREELGWLASPFEKPMWDFFLSWRENPVPSLHVPQMSPTGEIR